MNYKNCEWLIRESKSFHLNGMVAAITTGACSTCDTVTGFYRITSFGRPIYGRCNVCESWWLDRTKYQRATSFHQNTIKRAMGI
jgi:hypothetical protein